MDESVLRRRFGDKVVMRQQLQHLLDAAELPNVDVQICPPDRDRPSLPIGAFSYMQFPHVHDVPLHDIVSIEKLEGNYGLEDENETFKYRVAFEYLVAESLDTAASRDLVASTAQALSR
jgi:hypothetical protein